MNVIEIPLVILVIKNNNLQQTDEWMLIIFSSSHLYNYYSNNFDATTQQGAVFNYLMLNLNERVIEFQIELTTKRILVNVR